MTAGGSSPVAGDGQSGGPGRAPRAVALGLALAAILVCGAVAQPTTLPSRPGSLKFAVLGDTGTGGRAQREVATQLVTARDRFPFELALMLGDNLYGGETPADIARKFERPYAALLEAGVTFHATLGNHDEPMQRFYPGFNMNGQAYYSFAAPRQSVRFFAVESEHLDEAQRTWLEHALRLAPERWKILFMHHPIYSSGRRHGPDEALRAGLEPLLVRYGVQVVFAGHEHFYERLNPQQGITHFIAGGAAKLRRGNIRRDSPLTAAGFDRDNSCLLVEIDGDELWFEAISRTGETVDSGTIRRDVKDGRNDTSQ